MSGDQDRPEKRRARRWDGLVPTPRVARWLADHEEPEPVSEEVMARALLAVQRGAERRLLREAARDVRGEEGIASIGAYLIRVQTRAQVPLERIAEHIGAATQSLIELTRSDHAVARLRPAGFAALLDLVELPFPVAAPWATRALSAMASSGGLRSSFGESEAVPPQVEAFLRATEQELRARDRSDLL